MKRISVSELKKIYADYRNWLDSSWQSQGLDKFLRVTGPVCQGLWLDRFRSGYYRPTFFLRVLITPRAKGGADYLQFLSVLHGEFDLRQHKDRFDDITNEASCTVFPSLKAPLSPDDVFDGLVDRVSPTPAQAVSLASLAAYLGHENEFLKWKECFWMLLETSYSSSKNAYSEQYGDFLDALNLHVGEWPEYLEKIIAEQKVIEGIKE